MHQSAKSKPAAEAERADRNSDQREAHDHLEQRGEDEAAAALLDSQLRELSAIAVARGCAGEPPAWSLS